MEPENSWKFFLGVGFTVGFLCCGWSDGFIEWVVVFHVKHDVSTTIQLFHVKRWLFFVVGGGRVLDFEAYSGVFKYAPHYPVTDHPRKDRKTRPVVYL